jgi:hypothetical protein
MKRSEMIDKIYNKLIGTQPHADFAKQILDVVEELGMIPPGYKTWDEVQCEYDEFQSMTPKFFLKGKRVEAPVNSLNLVYEWEPEDEK